MGDLSLRLLGPPEVRHDGKPVTFRTRKVMALLIYLAVEGRLHSREKLTVLLWPESEEAQGRMLLRRSLMLLRQGLHEESEPPGQAHILVEREALGCNFSSALHLDVREVQKAVQASRDPASSTPGNTSPAHASRAIVAQLQAAAALYRGNFLEGFMLDDAPDFDDWLRLQREAWHTRIVLIFDRLSSLQFHRGEVTEAVEVAMRWLAYEPLNETVYQRLMQLYLALGNRDAALRTYETCRNMLAGELRAKPAPETEALRERIKMAAGISSPSPVSPSTAHASSRAYPSSQLVEGPLVGRANEYTRLVEAYYSAKQGRAQVVMLKGEAGIGKTRLASEFLRWAAAQGADVLAGRAFETGGRLSYQPLVEGLRSRLERENAPDDLLSDTWLAELSRLLPELRDRYPDLPAPEGDEATARNRLFEAVARLGQALAERAPLILFIDDVQWADLGSLDLLHYLARSWTERGTPVMLLMSIRDEALINPGMLTQSLDGLQHDLTVISLPLGALQLEDTLLLVQALGKSEASADMQEAPRFAQWLFAETGGQPFYMLEMLKALLQRNMLSASRQSDGSWAIDYSGVVSHALNLRDMLPSSVREVIRSRLAHLSTEAFALLAAGAVLGQGFDFEHAYEVADLKESQALPALDEVLKSQVVQEGAGRDGKQVSYFFVHDKIRDVIYTEAGDARRRVYHRRALAALERDQAPAAQLLPHALAAGLSEPALRFSITAGDSAMELFAARDAIAYYEQSRRLLAEQSHRGHLQPDVPIVHHLYERLGRAYELINDWEQAGSIYQSMLSLARESHLPAMECAALNRLATMAVYKSYDLEQATALLHSALQVAEGSEDTVELAETEWGLAQVNNYRVDGQAALAHGNSALQKARDLGMTDLIARCLNACAYACIMLGDWQEAETLAGEASALYRSLGNRPMESDCLCVVAQACIGNGRHSAGLEVAHKALASSEEIENDWGQANCNNVLAMGSLEAGAFSVALTYAQRAVSLSRSLGVSLMLNASLIILGKVLRSMMDVDAALATHLEIMDATDLHVAHTVEMTASELCADYALSGQWSEAYTAAVQALDHRLNSPFLFIGLTRWYEIEALVKAGEIERAVEDVRGFEMHFGRSRRHRIPYLRSLAVLAQSQTKFGLAIDHLKEAAQVAEEIGLPGELWLIWKALADLYLRQGEDEQAHRAYREAARIVMNLAATIEEDERRKLFLSSPLVQRVLQAAASREYSTDVNEQM
jgi:DNA-binding SARP family transcriptional activator